MTLSEDRRRKRSDDPLVALHYQLAQARQDARLEAIVVADDAGVVVAGCGAWPVCEELAAYAPLLSQLAREARAAPGSGRDLDGESRIAALRAEIDVRPVDVEGQTVLVCARGTEPASAVIERAAAGVARILKSAA